MKHDLNAGTFTWTAEAIDTAKTMWDAGASANEIANALPGNPSRNAVIGKLHRLGKKASTRTAGVKLPTSAPKRRRKSKAQTITEVIVSEPKASLIPDAPIEFEPRPPMPPPGGAAGVEYLQLQWYHCRELLNVRGSDGLLMSCGKPKVTDAQGKTSPYCREHHAKNMAPPWQRKERA